jgi:hypothetical protein
MPMNDGALLRLEAAQQDMRDAYAWGGTGVAVSALAWTTAGAVSMVKSPQHAVWALLIGGMLIHPVSTLLEKALGRRGQHAAGNPLASLAAANTVWLIACLPLAYVVSLQQTEWFFPAMLLVIGGRYLTFALLFGVRLYWALGIALIATACGLVALAANTTLGAFAGAAVEAVFATVLLWRARGDRRG